MAKKKQSETIWDTDSPVIVNPAAPTVKNDGWKLKWQRRALFTVAFVATPLALVLWISAAVNPPKPGTASMTNASVLTNSSPGKAAAIDAVNTWLSTTPEPLPGGRLVSWDGYRVLPQAKALNTASPKYRVELHFFTLASGTGSATLYFHTSLEVIVDPIYGVKVTSTPTLLPEIPSNPSGLQTASTWPGYVSVQAPQPVADAVTAWAAAFTSGKPEVLRLAVGDPNPAHAYLPLSGVLAKQISIVSTASVPLPDPKAIPTQMLVRVEFQLDWTVTATPSPSSSPTASKTLPTATYDLLVDGANTAAPRVVSWGGPGSGPSLKPFSTAANTKQITGAVAPSATSSAVNHG